MLASPVSDTRQFCQDLIDYYEGEIAPKEGKRSTWKDSTAAVKQYLSSLGRTDPFNYRSIYTQRQEMSEFMLDFVGWRDGPGGGAVLVCESEWAHTKDATAKAAKVVEDFDKLLSFKAPLKLLTFDSYDDQDARAAVIGEVQRYLGEFSDHRLGEHYIVIDLGWRKLGWECRIEREGRAGELKPVDGLRKPVE